MIRWEQIAGTPNYTSDDGRRSTGLLFDGASVSTPLVEIVAVASWNDAARRAAFYYRVTLTREDGTQMIVRSTPIYRDADAATCAGSEFVKSCREIQL